MAAVRTRGSRLWALGLVLLAPALAGGETLEEAPEATETACVAASWWSADDDWKAAYLKAAGALAARHDRRISGFEHTREDGHEIGIYRESTSTEGVKVLRREEEDGKRCVTVTTH